MNGDGIVIGETAFAMDFHVLFDGMEECFVIGIEQFGKGTVEYQIAVLPDIIPEVADGGDDGEVFVEEGIFLFPNGEESAETVSVFDESGKCFAVAEVIIGGSDQVIESQFFVISELIFECEVGEVTAPSGDIFTIVPVDHDNIFGESLESIGIEFVHIIPHHHTLAEFAGDDGMEEVDHVAIELLFAVISFGFLSTFLAIPDIERFIAADVHVGRGEEFGDFSEICFEELFDIGIGETEFHFRGTAESALDVAIEFAEVSEPFIIEDQFGMTDGSEAGDNIDAACFGVFDNFLDFGGVVAKQKSC